jgi:hypothetical protein
MFCEVRWADGLLDAKVACLFLLRCWFQFHSHFSPSTSRNYPWQCPAEYPSREALICFRPRTRFQPNFCNPKQEWPPAVTSQVPRTQAETQIAAHDRVYVGGAVRKDFLLLGKNLHRRYFRGALRRQNTRCETYGCCHAHGSPEDSGIKWRHLKEQRAHLAARLPGSN